MQVHAQNYSKLPEAEFQALQTRAHWGEKPAYTLANGTVGFRYPSDTQRSKVYAWDKAMTAQFPAELGRKMSLPEAQALCQRIFDDYGLNYTVDVRMGRRDKRGACAGLREVVFGYGSISMIVETVLHEACHTVLKAYNLCDSHGPRFAALLRECIHDYAGISRGYDLRTLGRARKVTRKYTRDWMGYATGVTETHRTTTVKFAAPTQIPAPLWRDKTAALCIQLQDKVAAGGVR